MPPKLAPKSSRRNRLLSGPLVKIEVGSGTDKREWSIHRNLLAHQSSVLAERLSGDEPATPTSPHLQAPIGDPNTASSPYSAAKTQGNLHTGTFQTTEQRPNHTSHKKNAHQLSDNLSLSFADINPEAFSLFVKYLYQGTLTPVLGLPSSSHWPYAFLCQQLYSLASSLRMPALQNALMDQFRQGCHAAGLVPGADEIALVYKSTESGSEMRKLTSQIAARQIMDPDNEREARGYKECFEISEFGVDVVEAIRRGVGGVLLEDPMERKGCAYHVHDNGGRCGEERKGKGKDGILK